jgi:photosystem II stability/assembly factor-like uncharacterized protein
MYATSCPSPTDCISVGGYQAQNPSAGPAEAVVTTDGGHRWHTVGIPGPADTVDCVDNGHCWASGAINKVWFTPDLGRSWRTTAVPTIFPGSAGIPAPSPDATPRIVIGGFGFFLSGVAFGTDTDGIAYGGARCGGYKATQCASGVFRTSDGGSTWTIWPNSYQSTYGVGDYAACIAHDCLLIADTFTHSVLVTSPDATSWTTRQTFPGYVGRPVCSPTGAVCILLGKTGLYTAHTG